MKAITVKYSGPTYSRGSRYIATDGDGCRVIIDHSPDWSTDRCYQEAVKALCRKRNWTGTLAEGFIMKSGRQDCRVYVWILFGEKRILPETIRILQAS